MKPIEVWTSYQHPQFTGIGFVQEKLREAMESSTEFKLKTPTASSSRVRSLVAEQLSAFNHRLSTALITASPTPLTAFRRSVLIVYDMRWLDTRGLVARQYRQWDLRRAGRKATIVLAISEPVAEQVSAFLDKEVRSCPLGPGRADSWNQVEGDGSVVLLGEDPHKNNQYAAKVLVHNSNWYTKVRLVGVDEPTQLHLLASLGEDRVEIFQRLSNDGLRGVLEASSFFLHLGRHEGFGMTYLEALHAGCAVIAADYPVARYVLGNTSILVSTENAQETSREIVDALGNNSRVANEPNQFRKFSWSRFIDQVSESVREASQM